MQRLGRMDHMVVVRALHDAYATLFRCVCDALGIVMRWLWDGHGMVFCFYPGR
jgi:hypothetical protein